MDNYTVVGYDAAAIQAAWAVEIALNNISQIRNNYIKELEELRKKYQNEFDMNLDVIKTVMDL